MLIKIKNIAVEVYSELGAFKNVSVSVACRLDLEDTFCLSLFIFKMFILKVISAHCSFPKLLSAATCTSPEDNSPSRTTNVV